MLFLAGYKTHILVAVSFVAQLVGFLKPEYAPIADKVSVGALALTPATVRMGVTAAVEALKKK